MRLLFTLLLCTVLVLSTLAVSLTAQQPMTDAERATYREQLARRRAQHDEWLGTADFLWDGEMAREKAGDCLGARSTVDLDECLGRELDITAANLKGYAESFRAIFRLEFPEQRAPDDFSYVRTAAEFLKDFDDVEAKWDAYKTAMCHSAFELLPGGTAASSIAAYCELKVMRNHMRELGGILGQFFHM
jgi:hypothetical protein